MSKNFQLVISTSFARRINAISIAESVYSMSRIDSIIICQMFDSEGADKDTFEQFDGYIIIYSYDRGLSKSRNLGLFCSSADIVWLLDDDVTVNIDNALKAFNYMHEHPEIDFLTTQFVLESGSSYKNYKSDSFSHGLLSSLKVSSIELFFRRQSVLDKGITYDTRFGLGSAFPSGEENIFLSDLVAKGATGKYLPLVTAIHPDVSSGWILASDSNAKAKGAMLKRIFGIRCYLIIPIFYFKKVLERRISFPQALSGVFTAIRSAKRLN